MTLTTSLVDEEMFELLRKEISQCTGRPLEELPTITLPQQQRPNVDFCCNIAKVCSQLGIDKTAYANELKEKIQSSDKKSLIKDVSVEKLFVNFRVDRAKIYKMVTEYVSKMGDKFGSTTMDEQKTVIVEHTSANPNASLHIGNLRSALVGAHLARLFKWVGCNVKELYFVNDLGAQIGLTAVGYARLKEHPPGYRLAHLTGYVYSIMNTFYAGQKKFGFKRSDLRKHFATYVPKSDDADVKLSEEEEVIEAACRLHREHKQLYEALESAFADDDDIGYLSAKLNKDYENKDPEAVKIVRRMVNSTLQGIQETLDCYNIRHDRFDYESEISWSGAAQAVINALKQSVFFHPQTDCNDQGKPEGAYFDVAGYLTAIGAKQGKGGYQDDYPRFYLLRPDGTTLYSSRDVGYAIKKSMEADMVLVPVCSEQALAMEKVSLGLKALGLPRKQFAVCFELVTLLEDGKVKRMSGRRGIYVLADDLYNDIKESTKVVMGESLRKKVDLQDEESVNKVTETVASANIIFSILSVSQRMSIDFDVKKAVDKSGHSAAFILMTTARINSIVKKFDAKVASGEIAPGIECDWSLLDNDEDAWEFLTKFIMRFASECRRAVLPKIPPEPKLPEFASHLIPCFAYNLANRFSSYYGRVTIINPDDPAMYPRIGLCRAVLQVLKNALRLFLVEPLDEM